MLGGRLGSDWRGHDGAWVGSRDVLFLNLSGSSVGMFSS